MRIVARTSLPGVTCAGPSSSERVARLEEPRRRPHGEGALEGARAGRPLERAGDRERGAVDRRRDDVGVDRGLDPAAGFDAREDEGARVVALADRAAVERARAGRVAQPFGQGQPDPHVVGGAGAGVLRHQRDAHAAAGLDLGRRVDDQARGLGVEAAGAADGQLGAGQLELGGLGRRRPRRPARSGCCRRAASRSARGTRPPASRPAASAVRGDRRVAEPERVAAALVDRDLAAVDPRAARDVGGEVGDRQHHDHVVGGRVAAVVHPGRDVDLLARLRRRAPLRARRPSQGSRSSGALVGDQAHDVRADDVGLVGDERRLQFEIAPFSIVAATHVGDRDAPLYARRDLADVGAVGRQQAASRPARRRAPGRRCGRCPGCSAARRAALKRTRSPVAAAPPKL